jgi:uncharacterized membrane protein YfcA
MHFPVSGVDTNPLLPPLVAFVISLFTSTAGVSGAILILPFQVSILGFTSPAVSSTNLVYNIVAIPPGVVRYIREGRMNWPVTLVVLLGTLPGLYFGALARVRWMLDPALFKLFVGCVLVYLGLRLVYEQTSAARKRHRRIIEFEESVRQRLDRVMKQESGGSGKIPDAARVRTSCWSLRRVTYEFLGEKFTFSVPGLFVVALAVGLVSGAYGMGGGGIMAPLLVALFSLPVYTIAGAALAGTLISSVAGVGIYILLAPHYSHAGPVAPDWALGALFGLGGFLGIYAGARLQKYLPGRMIRLGLGLLLTGLAFKYIAGHFL